MIKFKNFVTFTLPRNWNRFGMRRGVAMALLFVGLISPLQCEVYMNEEEAADYPGFSFQGEYEGMIKLEDGAEQVPAGLQVAVYGKNQFRGRLYLGGLPGDRGADLSDERGIELEGRYEDHVLSLTGDVDLSFRYIFNRFTALDEKNNYRGRLEPVVRESPVAGLEPPGNAVVLFDGSHLDHWESGAQMTDDGLLEEGATTAETYGDMHLHLEAKLGFMPQSENQRRANSGIYIQNRYEVQILDSFALPPTIDGNGSLYRVAAPLVNASYPPLSWQTYDVFFRAPRFDADGTKTENARVTAYLNGVLVQDDVELEKGTGRGGRREEVARAELYLQSHTGPVRFRNVWLVEDEYSPPGTEYFDSRVVRLEGGELR